MARNEREAITEATYSDDTVGVADTTSEDFDEDLDR